MRHYTRTRARVPRSLTKRVRFVSVHSIKGGTGKTTLSLAIAQLASQSQQPAVLLDCDFFGPTIEYTITDPQLTKDIKAYQLHTLYNAVRWWQPLSYRSTYSLGTARQNRSLPRAVVQSGAPSLAAYLSWVAIDERGGQARFRDALLDTLTTLSGRRRGTKFFVFDNSPGMYSHSAVIFALARLLTAHLVIVSSANRDCLIPTLYELPWDYDVLHQGRSKGNSPMRPVTLSLVINKRPRRWKGLKADVEGLLAKPCSPLMEDMLRFSRYVLPSDTSNDSGAIYLYNGHSVPFVVLPTDRRLAESRLLSPELIEECLGPRLRSDDFRSVLSPCGPL